MAEIHPSPRPPRLSPDDSPPPQICGLCGLPLGASGVKLKIRGEIHRFCCPGCRGVYQLLTGSPGGMPENFRETLVYRASVEAGLIPRGSSQDDRDLQPDGGGEPPPSVPPLSLALRIEGMWCPSCAWLIEEVLGRTKGLVRCQVLFSADLARIEYLPHLITPQEIMARVSRLGYDPAPFAAEEGPSPERKKLLVRLGVSAILTFNLMMIAFTLNYGFFGELPLKSIAYLSWPLAIMTTPVLFYGGWPILKKGLVGLRYGVVSMETLISIGALSAYFYSFFQIFQGSLHLYFDTASMLVTLVLLGKYLEIRAKEKASKGLVDLYLLASQKIRLCGPSASLRNGVTIPSGKPVGQGDGNEGRERWIPASEAKPGDEFLVLAGERVPLDAKIIAGYGNVDESILTGEAKPLKKTMGEEIMGGSLLLDGELVLKALRSSRESALGRWITLMHETLGRKNPAEILADRLIRRFVPAILLFAVGVGLYLGSTGSAPGQALLRALTILVISCPCALGLATPIVKVAAMGGSRSQGIIVREPAALEQAKDLTALVLDKTGTITEGQFALQQVFSLHGPENEALTKVASLEARSEHFIARAIVCRAREESLDLSPVSAFTEIAGMGVRGVVKATEIFAGNRQWIERMGAGLPETLAKKALALEAEAKTVVFFGWARTVEGFFVLGDAVKKGVRGLVQDLQARGLDLWLVSGDSNGTTRAVAAQAGIPRFKGQASPQEKVDLIRDLQAKGAQVGMIGDGINDAPALAQADIGFTLGPATGITQQAADFILLGSDPSRLLRALDLSSLTVRTIRQNLFFAVFYNALAIPLAASGLLNPVIAALAMFASSLTVVGNALRFGRAADSSCKIRPSML